MSRLSGSKSGAPEGCSDVLGFRVSSPSGSRSGAPEGCFDVLGFGVSSPSGSRSGAPEGCSDVLGFRVSRLSGSRSGAPEGCSDVLGCYLLLAKHRLTPQQPARDEVPVPDPVNLVEIMKFTSSPCKKVLSSFCNFMEMFFKVTTVITGR